MPIDQVHSFLVHPGKSEEEQPYVLGTRVPARGKLFDMVSDLFEDAEHECDIEIVFRPSSDGQQQNECRSALLAYLGNPTVNAGRDIAARLQAVTTHRSGLGLLFLAVGQDDEGVRLLLARFPADQGVIAHERRQSLDVEFIERVFMKNAHAYKSALYTAPSAQAGFWDGRAVDKQINDIREISDYWISEFLDSELRTTGPAGTKRLAMAMRSAISSATDPAIREELVAAAQLARGHHGRRTSLGRLVQNLGLSVAAAEKLRAALPRPELFDEVFQFDRDEYDKHVAYRSVELDNGAMLVAENARFDTVFQTESTNDAAGRTRFSTEGRVVRQLLRKTR
jgi:hypothetical protein